MITDVLVTVKGPEFFPVTFLLKLYIILPILHMKK